jgi:hypothetical protein
VRAWWRELRAAVDELYALYCLERRLNRRLTAQEAADELKAVRARRGAR